jgi:hypothetical protein
MPKKVSSSLCCSLSNIQNPAVFVIVEMNQVQIDLIGLASVVL